MSMFGDVNKVTLMGNITNDPELRFTPGGSGVLNFGLATNRSYQKDNNWTDEVTFHNIVVWRSAENLAKRVKKGTRVYVEGRLQVRTWENAEGHKQYKTEIVADDVILVARYEGGKDSEQGSEETRNSKSEASISNEGSKAESKKQAPSSDDSINPDDLPF